MTADRPPRVAERLVACTLAAEDRESVLGDLAEEFRQRARDLNPAAARRWYWRQCRRSIVANLRGRRDAAQAASARSERSFSLSAITRGTMRDVRDAFRSLRASSGVTAVAIVVLTLGIGASTAIFSVVDAVVLRDLPLPRSRELTVVSQIVTSDRNRIAAVAPQDFLDLNAQQDVFDGLAAWATGSPLTLQGSQPQSLRVVRATSNLFQVLQVAPSQGTLFTAANEEAGNEHVAVLSDAFWRGHFGADPRVVGQTMAIDGVGWRILGVMPPGFTFPLDRPTDAWIPYVMLPAERLRSTNHSAYLSLIGRLRPHVTVEQARARLDAITADLARQFPAWFKNRASSVRTLRETIIGADVQSWMLMLLAAVGFVLLIACVNVASLMLARASARDRDIGVRAALGASRWQLVRAVLVESVLLSAAGTALGVLAAYVGISAIRSLLPANLPRSADIAVNWRVLLAAIASAVVTGLACGILPALQGTRADLTRALRESGRVNSSTRSRQRLRAILVVAEVSLAVVLLVGAGLFMASFVRLTSVDLGLNYEHVLTVGVMPRGLSSREARAAAATRIMPLVNDALPRIRSIPGVEYAAALSGTRPLEGGSDRSGVVIRGRENDFKSEDDAADVYRVTPDYMKAIGVSIVRGRSFLPDETSPDAPAVLLNESAAARYFPDVDPIGQPIGLLGARTVVGIVHNVRAGGPETSVRPEAYLSFSTGWAPFAYIVIRTSSDPAAIIPAVKTAVWSAAPDLPLSDIETLEGFLGKLVAPRKFNMLLIGLFGVLALTIASVGIFGVMAYIVEQRRAEIGLRMALGAQPGEVVGMMLRRALTTVSVGLAIGLAASWPLAAWLRAFLFQVGPHDLSVYAAAAAVILAAGLLAAFGPARRAARIDPIIALRAD